MGKFKWITLEVCCNIILKNFNLSPASVDQWLSKAHEPRGDWFDSQSGSMPGFRAWSPVGACRRQLTDDGSVSLMFLSLHPSLSKKQIKKIKINRFKSLKVLFLFNFFFLIWPLSFLKKSDLREIHRTLTF